jgi:hypothetical protein
MMSQVAPGIEPSAAGLSEQDRPSRAAAGIRLLHVTTVPESLRFLTGQARQMRDWGIETHVLSSPGDELDSFAAREGAHAHGVPMERRITPIRDLLAVFGICRVMRSVRPRIVHAHTPKAGVLAMVAARLVRIPVRVYHLHGLRFMTAEGFPACSRIASCASAIQFARSRSRKESARLKRSGSCSAEASTASMSSASSPRMREPGLRGELRWEFLSMHS